MRNKMKGIGLICLSILLLLNASPWEGAAATAPNGLLPAEGMFVATNSFPVNTVVDITNIETNKSTRVIVARGLDSPGLLAIVSREAAELIGMRAGSISRLRMAQPDDPIAYLRFIEGQAAGIPAYDSGDVITEEVLRERLYAEDAYTPPANGTASSAPAHSGVTGPSYVLEPEWKNRSEEIVDITRYEEPVIEEEYIAEEEPAEADDYFDDYYDDYLVYDEYEEEEYIAEENNEEEPDEYIEEEDYIAESEEEVFEDEWNEYYDELEYLAEEIDEEEYDDTYDEEDEYLVEEEPIEEEFEEEEYIAEEEPLEEEYITEYDLVPAEERPPELIYGIDPNDIIPETALVPAEPVSAEPVRTITDTTSFSVPRVSALQNGSYYVQIAALDTPEMVENTLRGIDHSYKPVIYKDGDKWYRILLGPMNQGESAAVLARFKSIGYKDAFVRLVR